MPSLKSSTHIAFVAVSASNITLASANACVLVTSIVTDGPKRVAGTFWWRGKMNTFLWWHWWGKISTHFCDDIDKRKMNTFLWWHPQERNLKNEHISVVTSTREKWTHFCGDINKGKMNTFLWWHWQGKNLWISVVASMREKINTFRLTFHNVQQW